MKRLIPLVISLLTISLFISCGVSIPPEEPPCSTGAASHSYDDGKLYADEGTVPYIEYTCTACGSAYTADIPSSSGDGSSLAKMLPFATSLSGKTVSSIRYEKGAIGVAPESFATVLYSDNEADIASALSILYSELAPISQNAAQIDGGGYIEYTYITADGSEYTVRFSNGAYNHEGQSFVLKDRALSAPASPNLEALTFIEPGDNLSLYDNGELIGNFAGLDKLEFSPYSGPITLMIPTLYATTGAGSILRIYNSNIFSYQKKGEASCAYYTITGDFDFSFAFEGDNT